MNIGFNLIDLDEIEEELAPLTESLEPPPMETYADQLDKARKATFGLSWVQILGKHLKNIELFVMAPS